MIDGGGNLQLDVSVETRRVLTERLAPSASRIVPFQLGRPAAVLLEPLHENPYVCRITDTVIAAIEKCLDNGLGACLVVDRIRRLRGAVTLEGIRRSIVSGTAATGASLADFLEPHDEMPERDRRLQPIFDRKGRVADVAVDRSGWVPLARPDLTRHEFRAVLDAFLSSWISGRGPYIEIFEQNFADYVGMPHGVAVSSGTAALHLALTALNVGPGDEVIVPDLTFAATINAVIHAGATPVIVDIDPDTWTMSLTHMARAWTARTKAVIPVHLYGRPAQMEQIASFAKARGAWVLEDCAEAHGAAVSGRMVGQFSDISCFSFYANKLITTGEGGMCLTGSPELAATMRELRDHGLAPDRCYWHERVGFNYRMTNVQAAIGQAQLPRIAQTIAGYRRLEASYREKLNHLPGLSFPPPLPAEYAPVVWLVSVLVPPEMRSMLIDAARCAGIELRPFFHSLSSMPLYERYGDSCPNSLALGGSGVSLPTSRIVDETMIRRVARIFEEVLGNAVALSPALNVAR